MLLRKENHMDDIARTEKIATQFANTSNKNIVIAAYLGYLIPFPLLFIIALIVNYIARSETNDNLANEHHSYMIRTFWWMFLWTILAVPFCFLLIGYIALFIIWVWQLIRIIRGLIRACNNLSINKTKN
jgi:uncharacterized membrane protein